jgi:ABC-type microcin C transport system permease subunit YejE
MARAVRAKVSQLRETEFILALKGLEFSSTRIMVFHLLPNVSEIVSAKFVLSVAGAMISEASLMTLCDIHAFHKTLIDKLDSEVLGLFQYANGGKRQPNALG